MLHEILTDNMQVSYEIVRDSFDHAFGIQKTINYEIKKIEAYVPALEMWIDVTNLSEFSDAANKLLEKEVGQNE